MLRKTTAGHAPLIFAPIIRGHWVEKVDLDERTRGLGGVSTAADDRVPSPLQVGIESELWSWPCNGAGGRVPKDRLIGDLAARQYGVVARRQLLSMGIGAGAIATRLHQHYLHPLHRGAYAVGHLSLIPIAREMAAVLACGAGSAVRHRSAAVVWHLLPANDDTEIDVTVRSKGRGSRPGLRVRRSTRLSPQDFQHLRGLPVTAPWRALVDLAETSTKRDLERATHEALTRRLVNAHRLLADLDRYRGRRGIHRLKELVEIDGPTPITRSEAEARFLALVRASGLPAPEVNVQIHGHEVDFLWRDQRLVVEVDGFRFHSTRDAFERDRAAGTLNVRARACASSE